MIATPSTPAATRYLQPGWVTKHVFNPLMALMTKSGMSIRGSRVLHVQGRTTGEWRTVPVNPLTIDGQQYLVAPRGETQWVRNMRVAGGGKLQLGRRRSDFTATELTDAAAKARILQQYLQLWKAEVGVFFAGVDATSLDALAAIAAGYPVFAVTTAPAA
jgi:deazaflavin-dependent oxidoreductase (nitroreductase family)